MTATSAERQLNIAPSKHRRHVPTLLALAACVMPTLALAAGYDFGCTIQPPNKACRSPIDFNPSRNITITATCQNQTTTALAYGELIIFNGKLATPPWQAIVMREPRTYKVLHKPPTGAQVSAQLKCPLTGRGKLTLKRR